MKSKVVSAPRSKRGLRSEVNRNAEPQVEGLAPQPTGMTERADTMKTYILRGPKTVEPQSPLRPLRAQPTAGTITQEGVRAE